eukprot:CAMPEP_0181210324 /NCGR_PEP_ID=MMETSP1096-20121128/23163_1 /TAXON_ID=156174 ORGANISM="Chrysochromulina ericina, Strain CCMP281" /NCGR_SAMPLE_ID=MMETSP1096 /ASSEMBLY_ACC=CAM_ASM_000453 /LENGTH=289 /DNA_ID=CAMNT_0023301593 /DNA_START=93 /DNA_END=962 /DNA_ORIENTATION=-
MHRSGGACTASSAGQCIRVRRCRQGQRNVRRVHANWSCTPESQPTTSASITMVRASSPVSSAQLGGGALAQDQLRDPRYDLACPPDSAITSRTAHRAILPADAARSLLDLRRLSEKCRSQGQAQTDPKLKGPLIRTGTAKGWIPLACGADENLRHDCKQKRYETRGSPLHALLRPPALQPSSSAATCHRQPSNPWVEPPSPPPGPGPPQQRPNTSHGAASQNSGASSVLTRPARFVALYECINSTSDVAELDLTRSTRDCAELDSFMKSLEWRINIAWALACAPVGDLA